MMSGEDAAAQGATAGARLVVTGSVQGVGYRAWVVRRATELGVTGWVRNRPDGSVEVEVHGAAAQLTVFRRLLAEGPPHARVRAVEEGPAPGGPPPEGFAIRR